MSVVRMKPLLSSPPKAAAIAGWIEVPDGGRLNAGVPCKKPTAYSAASKSSARRMPVTQVKLRLAPVSNS